MILFPAINVNFSCPLGITSPLPIPPAEEESNSFQWLLSEIVTELASAIPWSLISNPESLLNFNSEIFENDKSGVPFISTNSTFSEAPTSSPLLLVIFPEKVMSLHDKLLHISTLFINETSETILILLFSNAPILLRDISETFKIPPLQISTFFKKLVFSWKSVLCIKFIGELP